MQGAVEEEETDVVRVRVRGGGGEEGRGGLYPAFHTTLHTRGIGKVRTRRSKNYNNNNNNNNNNNKSNKSRRRGKTRKGIRESARWQENRKEGEEAERERLRLFQRNFFFTRLERERFGY